MELIDKEEITKRLQALIDARQGKNCSKQAIVESQCFRYALAIVNQCEVHDKEL